MPRNDDSVTQTNAEKNVLVTHKEKHMKKKTTQRRTKAAVAATLMAMPMLSSPGLIYGQKGAPPTEVGTKAMIKSSPDMYWKFSENFHKHKGDLWLAGVGDGHTIYEKPNGEMFYIDTKTGDMKEVSSKVFHKAVIPGVSHGRPQDKADKSVDGGMIKGEYIKFDGIKGESKVKLLGVDANGDVVHQKPNGEMFTVNKKTGHITLMK